jgi:AraC-like DNA-binding protein
MLPCTRCCFRVRCVSTRRAPASASTRTTWNFRCAATSGPFAPVLHDPAADALHAEGLARALNVSLRTLHRHLQQEGASVQALKDEVRCGRAQDLLRRTRQPVKQIAHQIGYRSEKSFARAFRQWTGAAPSDWRAGGPVTPSDMISPAISGRIGIRPAGQGVPDDA